MKPRGSYDDTLYLRIPVALQDDIRTLGAYRQMDLNECVVEALRYYREQFQSRLAPMPLPSPELSRT